MQETFLKFDGSRYRLIVWCVMPNHVHALIDPKDSLARIVQSWKSYTGRWILARDAELGLGVPGKECWMREYWDRYIRDENHLRQVIHYIHENPVKTGLCETATDWPWSSAARIASEAPGPPSPSSAPKNNARAPVQLCLGRSPSTTPSPSGASSLPPPAETSSAIRSTADSH
jgi:REP element-mobilizing transposase RayT